MPLVSWTFAGETSIASGMPCLSTPRWIGRPNRAESYGKEPDFQPNFSFNLRAPIDWPSEAEFRGNNAGNHGGHVGFPVLWSGPRPSFPQ